MANGEPCRMCRERGKTWSGSNPKCAFLHGTFQADNWNCATANAIRYLTGQDEPEPPRNSDTRWCDDQWYSTIRVYGVDLPSDNALALWVSWYKHRGRTDAMWLLSEHSLPRPPTEDDCLAIIAAMTEDE